MAITNSEIIEKSLQIDGRYWVREKHTDNLGKHYFLQFLTNEAAPENNLPTHALYIWNNILDGEIVKLVQMAKEGKLNVDFIPDYCTRIDVLRAVLRIATTLNCYDSLKLLTIINYVKNNYTVTQIASALGITVAKLGTIYGRFTNIETNIKPLIEADDTNIMEI